MAFSSQPIHRAIYEPKLNLDHIKALITSDPSCLAAVNRQNGYLPLHAAARRGDPALTKLLVEAGCYIDARTATGQTPFLLACQIGNVRNLHMLAEGGADSDLTDDSGKCGFHYAALMGSVPIMHYLVKVLNNDPNKTDNKGNTALHHAVMERIIKSVDYLLRHKYCDINQANHAGATPLHIAAKNGSMKIVWELLIHSRSKDCLLTKNGGGNTAEEVARKGNSQNHHDVVKQLYGWNRAPSLMRKIPWMFFFTYFITPAVFMIIADLAFCYLDNPTMALIFGVGLGAAGFYFPVRPHRIPHQSGWHNPAFMGAMLTEVLHTSLCYALRVLPILWPNNLLMLCFLVLNSIFGLFIFFKFMKTDPGFDKVGKIGSDGKPLTIMDVVKQQHNLSYFEAEKELVTGSYSVLQFCDVCEIVIPDRTKHCKLCNACCNGFDHHCLWLTSCVGLNNHRLFVLFNIALTIEGLIFLWDGVASLSVAMGDDFPFNLFQTEAFLIEKWIKFRILVTICTVIFTAKIVAEQLCNISRLETTYFDLTGKAAYGKQRGSSSFTWRTRMKLIFLFFTNYGKWYSLSCQSSSDHRNIQV